MLNTGAGTESYTWNAEERMATVTSSLYGDNTYTYDGHGQRVEKSSGMLYWYGAGGEVLAESDLSGNITNQYVFFNGHRLARIDASGNVDYYVADKLGSASVVTDANGNKLDDCDYLPYGQTNCVTSSSGNHYLYTGLERDADQLDHTLHRQYSSSLGRWMSPDPGGRKVVNLANPQTWNMYTYVTDNPTSSNDPTGMAPAIADGDGCSSPAASNGNQTCGKVQELVDAQNAAMANSRYAPNPVAGTTHCNQAACSIVEATGGHSSGIFANAKGVPYDANTQIHNLANPKNGFHAVSPEKAQKLADRGVLVWATQRGVRHGHIASVRPEGVPGDHPRGRRGPLLANVGLFNGVARQSAVFTPIHGRIIYYAPNK